MEFEWDHNKNHTNFAKHGFNFADAEEVFKGYVFAWPDQRKDYGEERWIGMGVLGEEIVLMVWTMRPTNRVRMISMRKAGKREWEIYRKAVQKRHGQNSGNKGRGY